MLLASFYYLFFFRYLELFDIPEKSPFINYEKSTAYFHDEKVPKRIKALIEDVKLIFFLKNPIDRAHSVFQV